MNSPQFHSPEQFSAASGLSIATIRRYLRDRKLPFVQPGGPRGRILIPADALARLAMPQLVRPAEPVGTETPAEKPPVAPVPRPGPVPAWRRGRTL